MSEHGAPPPGDADPGVAVGMAAARLGITGSTLRSWERRYGVSPSVRTAGGHRRYSKADLARLDQLQRDLHDGVAPAVAAAAVMADDNATASQQVARGRRRAGPGGRVVAVPGADGATRGLARAAAQLDLDGAENLVLDGLRGRGVLRTWDEMLRPVLVAVGKRWAESGDAIEVEHVLTEATLGALHRRRAEVPVPEERRPVLLASAPGDQHTLTLHVLALGLGERLVPARVLGAQVPPATLAAAIRRVRPAAVFVGCVVIGTGDPDDLVSHLPRTRPPTRLVVGGDGWPDELPPLAERATGLGQAIELLVGPVAG